MPTILHPATAVLVCGPDLKPITDPVAGWTNIDVILRHNEVSSGAFTVPGDVALKTAVATPGARVVIMHEGSILIGGPVEVAEEVWERDGEGLVNVTFADHLAGVAGRQTYPNPLVDHPLQNVPHWAATGEAETIMRDLVNLNAGPGALTHRRIPGLAVGSSGGAGESITFISKAYEPLTDALRRLAIAGGGLGFRIVQVGLGLRFDAFLPRDRSKAVRYSVALGTVDGLTIRRESPKATVALVGILDEDALPVVGERSNTPAVDGWGRLETFVTVPRDVDVEQVNQAGNEALTENGPKVGIVVQAQDRPGQKFGVDYVVGDYVGVELGNGQAIKELVTEVRLSITPKEQTLIVSKIGTGDVSVNSTLAASLRAMDRRLGRIERR